MLESVYNEKVNMGAMSSEGSRPMSKQTTISKSATPNFNKRLKKKEMVGLLQI
jgi:hypothetical protein